MDIFEEYNPNSQVWYCGRSERLGKFYKPTPSRQMFFTNDPHYALLYMDNGYINRKKGSCIVTTVNKFKLRVFDFSSMSDVSKLGYPIDISQMLASDSFWQNTMRMHKCCMDAKDKNYGSTSESAKAWYKEKFKGLLIKGLDPNSGNDALYQFQAVILEDLTKLGYTAYYNFDYDDEHTGAESLVLFNVSAIDKVIPVELTYIDMQDLISEIDNGNIDKDSIQQIKDFVSIRTGARHADI